MKTITKWEWHGNGFQLFIYCISIVLIPFAIVHFIENLVMITQDEPPAETV